MRFNHIKKILVLIGAGVMVSLSAISPVRGQTGGGDTALLAAILDRVNNLPAALVSLGTLTSAWMDPDTTDAAVTMQGNFSQLGQLLPQNLDAQASLQTTLNNYLLSNDGKNIYYFNDGTQPAGKSPTPKSLKYANDLVYSTLLGQPYFAKDARSGVDSSLNYIINASGMNIYHSMPFAGGGGGSINAQRRYQSLYNTLMAATTFNNYVLSYNYADKNQFTTLQKTLIQTASDPKAWFGKVGSESIGFVLRQLLVYQSQIFVLLTQVVQLQKQMVTAQAINTAVLIANNQINEATMASYASGSTPTLN